MQKDVYRLMWVSHQTEMFDLMERIIKRWREEPIKHTKIKPQARPSVAER